MLRLQSFAILILLSLPATKGMFIGQGPMMPQTGFGAGPMQMAGGPFMGHPNALMMPHPDYDHPDIHPAVMYHQPVFPGALPQGMSFQGPPPPGSMMQGGQGARTLPGQVVHQPAAGHHPQVVQSHMGALPAAMAQRHAGSVNPNTVHHSTGHGAAASQPHVNQVVAQAPGGVVVHPGSGPRQVSRVAANVGAGHHGGGAVHAHSQVQQSPRGAVQAAQGGVSTAYRSSGVQQQQQQQRAAASQTAGLVSSSRAATGQQSVSAVRPTLVQQGTIHHAPNPAGGRMVQPQPGPVPRTFAAGPMAMAGVGGRLSRMSGMALGQRGGLAMARFGPFPRDGTYKTARGTYTRDGSDLSFDPRY